MGGGYKVRVWVWVWVWVRVWVWVWILRYSAHLVGIYYQFGIKWVQKWKKSDMKMVQSWYKLFHKYGTNHGTHMVRKQGYNGVKTGIDGRGEGKFQGNGESYLYLCHFLSVLFFHPRP